jgi:hypothetical protein
VRWTVEHGHANNFANEYSSVASWYQPEPHATFPALPARDALRPALPPAYDEARESYLGSGAGVGIDRAAVPPRGHRRALLRRSIRRDPARAAREPSHVKAVIHRLLAAIVVLAQARSAVADGPPALSSARARPAVASTYGSGHFGSWFVDAFGLPAFRYEVDQDSDPRARQPELAARRRSIRSATTPSSRRHSATATRSSGDRRARRSGRIATSPSNATTRAATDT